MPSPNVSPTYGRLTFSCAAHDCSMLQHMRSAKQVGHNAHYENFFHFSIFKQARAGRCFHHFYAEVSPEYHPLSYLVLDISFYSKDLVHRLRVCTSEKNRAERRRPKNKQIKLAVGSRWTAWATTAQLAPAAALPPAAHMSWSTRGCASPVRLWAPRAASFRSSGLRAPTPRTFPPMTAADSTWSCMAPRHMGKRGAAMPPSSPP